MHATSTSSSFKLDAPIASLTTIRFHDLLDRSPGALDRLMHACQNVGFFYLDLTDPGCSSLFDNLDDSLEIMKNWFAQPLNVKKKTAVISNSHGYKPTGLHAGVGKARDGWEALKIGKSELSGRWAVPPVVDSNLNLFASFQSQCHFITKILLECISSGLGLRGNNNLQQYHRDDAPSKSSLFYLHYPPRDEVLEQDGQNQHTDIGTLTLLFAFQWGLQVLCPTGKDEYEWQLVEPRPGHAIINVGDTLRFLSGYKVRSALHRALAVENIDRFSVAYFLRPSDDSEFTDIDGNITSAVDWYRIKNHMYERANEKQETAVLTGGLLA